MEERDNRNITWEVYVVMLTFAAVTKKPNKLMQIWNKTHYILIDDKEHKIYIVPRRLSICGRNIKIELE